MNRYQAANKDIDFLAKIVSLNGALKLPALSPVMIALKPGQVRRELTSHKIWTEIEDHAYAERIMRRRRDEFYDDITKHLRLISGMCSDIYEITEQLNLGNRQGVIEIAWPLSKKLALYRDLVEEHQRTAGQDVFLHFPSYPYQHFISAPERPEYEVNLQFNTRQDSDGISTALSEFRAGLALFQRTEAPLKSMVAVTSQIDQKGPIKCTLASTINTCFDYLINAGFRLSRSELGIPAELEDSRRVTDALAATENEDTPL